MKLVRFGETGRERPGLIGQDGAVRDLSSLVPDLGPESLSPEALERLRGVDPAGLPPVPDGVRLGAPVARVGKIVAIGLNYRDHAEEAGLGVPTEPAIFLKAVTSISGPNDDIVIPPGSVKTDWEVELGIVIGTRARRVSEDEAMGHVAGYLCVNDVSEREYQLERGGTWDKGKGCDSFAPLGPWLVTADEVPNPQALELWLNVNGVRRQSGSTAAMIAGVRKIVSYASGFMTLEPGDIIATGTPAGVGLGCKPPEYLKPGDVVELGITGLGAQRNVCSGG
jgi:2-keto-4-pentenoate hydratase/2-oxohepta-3-ene-1,7-dioic acid hydratase in catechol pathway